MQIVLGSVFVAGMIGAGVLFLGGRTRAAVALLLLAGLSLKIVYAASPTLGWWDERYHALVAKNMMAHPLRPTLIEAPAIPYDFRDWQGNHVWLHKPPLALWLMAGSMSLFGCETLPLRLPSVLMSVGAVFLTFLIGRRLLGERPGFIAAYFHTICPPLLLLAIGRGTTDHIDTAMVFFVELGVYVAVRCVAAGGWRWLVPLGLVTGAALLTKWLPGLIVLGVWQLLPPNRSLRTRAVEIAIVVAVVVAVVAPWHVHIHADFPMEARYEQHYNTRHVFEVIEGHDHPFYIHLWNIVMFFGFLAPVAIVWFLVDTRRRPGSFMPAIAAWFVVPYVFFSLTRTRMASYVLISSPAIFLMMAWLWERVRDGRWPDRWAPARPLVLALLVLAPLYPGFGGIRVRRSEADRQERDIAIRMRQMPELAGLERAVVFNVRHPAELMFFTPVTAYEQLPPVRDVLANTAGRPILVCDDGSGTIPSEWKAAAGVTVLSVPPGF